MADMTDLDIETMSQSLLKKHKELMKKIIEANPKASKSEIYKKFRTAALDDDVTRAIVEEVTNEIIKKRQS